MAIEYRLAYTAQEIDRKLRKIDEIDNKQDKLAFDSAPTEGSENLVKSGDIHAALQNVGGGTNYISGDLIEIKDGVISSTLGKCISGELIEKVDAFLSVENISMIDNGGTYVFPIDSLDKTIDSNTEKLTIEFILPNGEKKTFDIDVDYNGYEENGYTEEGWQGFYNCGFFGDGKDEQLIKIDENSDALLFNINHVVNEDGEFFEGGIMAWDDYTGATLTIGTKTIVDTRKYALLPDNALGLGRKIETEYIEELVNIKNIEIDYNEEDEMGETYFALSEFPDGGSTVEVFFTPSGETKPVHYTEELVEFPLMSSDDFVSYAACCNASFTEDGMTVMDESLPAFLLVTTNGDGEDDGCFFYFISTLDYNGASIVITTKTTTTTHVKLPNEALSFDSEPTEDSENLVNSGVVYKAIQNIDTSELTGKIEELTGKMKESTGKIEELTGKMEESTGKMIGKNGDGNGSEIFNDYINNVASGHYSHAEGFYTKATSFCSHAEGYYTTASDSHSHAEGEHTTASGSHSHAEGYYTTASGSHSHAEGYYTTASGSHSHAEGYYTTASGIHSHAEGEYTNASSSYQHVQGKCNIEDTENKYAHIVGNGELATRSNAHTLDWEGNAWFAGAVEATVIILSSPNGTRFQITVDDNGTLSATEINE